MYLAFFLLKTLPKLVASSPIPVTERLRKECLSVAFFFSCVIVCLVVFNATFNNISVISWWSVLLVEESRGPGENHRFDASH